MSTSAKQTYNRAPRKGLAVRFLVWLSAKLSRIIMFYLVTLVVACLIFWATEDYSFGDSAYWTYVTSLTIGYGDISPKYFIGRSLVFFFGHIWTYFIGALIITNIIESVRRDENQYSHAEQEWTMESLHAIASALGVELKSQPSDTTHGDVG